MSLRRSLFIAQCDSRIEAHGAPDRAHVCDNRGRHTNDGPGDEAPGICWLDTVKLTRQQSSGFNSASDSKCCSAQCEPEASAEEEPEDFAASGAQSRANSNLLGPPRRHQRDNAVDADHTERHRDECNRERDPRVAAILVEQTVPCALRTSRLSARAQPDRSRDPPFHRGNDRTRISFRFDEE